MTITERIFMILSQKKLSQKDFAKKIGVNEKTVSAWKKNNSLPPLDKISNISDCLGASIDYILTGKEKNSPAVELSADERELLDIYNSLSPKSQGRLRERAEVLAELEAPAEPVAEGEAEERYWKIDCSTYQVSAGIGFELGESDEWYEIEVSDTPEARRADFALQIKGNSMEPIYFDGDIVLVKEQPSVDLGEIGIFSIEGYGYIKKYGGDKLISLNAEYDDIEFSDYDEDSIRCHGKVIGRV